MSGGERPTSEKTPLYRALLARLEENRSARIGTHEPTLALELTRAETIIWPWNFVFATRRLVAVSSTGKMIVSCRVVNQGKCYLPFLSVRSGHEESVRNAYKECWKIFRFRFRTKLDSKSKLILIFLFRWYSSCAIVTLEVAYIAFNEQLTINFLSLILFA